VKKTINALACALIASLAFAQTSTPKTQQPTTCSATITAFEPGKIVVVGSESGHDTFSYVLDDGVRYVNKAGRQINEHLIKSGTRVHVYHNTGATGPPWSTVW
jgi:hypothetical protein